MALLNALVESAKLKMHTGDMNAAIATSDRARVIGEDLVRDHPANPDFVAALAIAAYTLGRALEARGQVAQSRVPYELRRGASGAESPGIRCRQ